MQSIVSRTWTRRGRLGAIIGVGACAAAIAGCGSSGQSGATGSGGSSSGGSGGGGTSLSVALPLVDATFLPVYLAEQQGFYKQQGLNVKIVTFQGGADATKAVVGGSVDLGVNGLGGVMPAVSQGVKAIYGGFNEVSYEWVASKDVTSVRQVAGKAWGVTKVGSDTDYVTRYVLARNGINPTTGAKIVQGIVSSPTALAALGSGQLQVAVSARDQAGPLLANPKYHVIASEAQYTKSYPDHVVFAKGSYIKSHSATITKFLRALSQAITYEKSHPKQSEAAITKYAKIPSQYAAGAYKSFAANQRADGALPGKAGMKFFWQVGIQNGEYKAVVPESKWLDPKWINSYSQWSKQ